MICQRKLLFMAAAFIALIPVSARSNPPRCAAPKATLLAAGLERSIGSTVGPDGALYVAEGAAGRISRIDPNTGEVTAFATGLPKATGLGGPMDVAFLGDTAYALVTLVSSDVGGTDIDGIYRIDGPNRFTVVANIGRWSIAHPPKPAFFVSSGVQYALETYRGRFLVTDGHHNRVLRVTVDRCMISPPDDDSNITELIAFDNIVPTGLSVSGNTIYMAEAGPIPHLPQDGKVVEFGFKSPTPTEVASGARLLVDVETGPRHQLYALSQGVWGGPQEGDPALPNTGSLVKVDDEGGFTVVTDHLDRPASLEFIGNTAYITSLAGEVWKIEDVSCRHRPDSR
jgi:DNA-binding beta-propeller fold protein YncE